MKGHLWSSVGGAVGLMACGVLISSGAEAEDDAKEHRNLLLISMDTCRYDHMGLAGYSRDTTPNIDRLAELGTNFTRAFAQSNETFLPRSPPFHVVTCPLSIIHIFFYKLITTVQHKYN